MDSKTFATKDFNDIIKATGCAETYQAVEDCLVKNDRNMGKCQADLDTFRVCYEEVQKKKRAERRLAPSVSTSK
jgi:hypothetical protein